MGIAEAPRFKLFLLLSAGCVLLLSLAWIWLGVGYVDLLLRTVSPLAPATVLLEQQDHEVLFVARSATGSTVQAGMHGMTMAYGLILATAVLVAMPGLALRARLILLGVAGLTAFVAHVVGLYMLAQRLDSIVSYAAVPKEFAALAGTLTYVWLFVPSLVWAPALMWRWRLLRWGPPSPRRPAGQRHSRRASATPR